MTPLPLCPGTELCITQAAMLQEAWLQALGAVEPGQPVLAELDASAVEALDSAGVQLLLALKALVERQGGQLQLKAPNALVKSALAVFGLDDTLNPGAAA